MSHIRAVNFDKKTKSKIAEIADIIHGLTHLSEERIVIKCGGKMMDDEDFLSSLVTDIAILDSLGVRVILVHGAGQKLDKTLERLKLKSEFFQGYRVTNSETMEIVEMVMTGLINKIFVKKLLEKDVNALGISCKDANLITAKRIRRTQRDEGSNIERIIDLGFIGEPESMNHEYFNHLLEDTRLIPIISPIAFDKNYTTYSINADVLACYIGAEIKAKKVIILSENTEIMGTSGSISGSLPVSEIENALYAGSVSPEMTVRLKACLDAIKGGVDNVHIVQTSLDHPILMELSSPKPVSTVIYSDKL